MDGKKNCTFFRHCIFLLLFLCHHKPCGVDSTMWTIGNEWSKIFDCEIRYDCLRWKRECKLDDRTNCGRFPTSVDSLVRNPKGWTIRASTVFELVATDFIIVRGSSELRNSSIQKNARNICAAVCVIINEFGSTSYKWMKIVDFGFCLNLRWFFMNSTSPELKRQR